MTAAVPIKIFKIMRKNASRKAQVCERGPRKSQLFRLLTGGADTKYFFWVAVKQLSLHRVKVEKSKFGAEPSWAVARAGTSSLVRFYKTRFFMVSKKTF